MREMKKIFAGILMTVLLTGCSSQEILSEVPQTIVLPEEQIDSLPMQEEDPTSAETENTESFSLLEEGGSRFAYESLSSGTDLVSGDRTGTGRDGRHGKTVHGSPGAGTG